MYCLSPNQWHARERSGRNWNKHSLFILLSSSYFLSCSRLFSQHFPYFAALEPRKSAKPRPKQLQSRTRRRPPGARRPVLQHPHATRPTNGKRKPQPVTRTHTQELVLRINSQIPHILLWRGNPRSTIIHYRQIGSAGRQDYCFGIETSHVTDSWI